MNPKQQAALAAMREVRNGMIVGLGTGSTAEWFIRALGEALAGGKLLDIRGIPTSNASEELARKANIPIIALVPGSEPDLTVDGADEIDPGLDLIKGMGGALLREKIVAQNSRRLLIIADSSKRVACLGTRSPLPVEVVPFCHESHVPFFQKLGSTPVLRRKPDGAIFVTDNGNYLYDCRFDGIDDPAALEDRLLHRAGVVECGLFLGMAEAALVADGNGVEELRQ